MKKNNNSIKFNLVEGEVIRKIQYTKDSMMVSRIATFSFLKVLDHEGLLPKGYLTRVKNGHISYHTSVLMCRKQFPHSAYRLESTKYGEYTLIGLVAKPTLASLRELHGEEDNGWVDEPESTPQPEPTPEQLIKVVDLTEKEAYNYCDVHHEVRDCGNCPTKHLCYTEEAIHQHTHGDSYTTEYTICPSCKREVYNDTFMQNVGECEGCHWMGSEWVLENIAEQQDTQEPIKNYSDGNAPF